MGNDESVSVPPRLAARATSRRRSQKPKARSLVPSVNVTMPPNPLICRFASSCSGCEGRPGYQTRCTARCSESQRATRSAVAQWRSIRSAKVFRPRSRSYATCGSSEAPSLCESSRSGSRRSLEPASTPARWSEWPFRYLVALCITTSTPISSGRCSAGGPKVESITLTVPAFLHAEATAATSTLRIVDVAAVASACRKAGTVSVMDSTFGPPALQRPLEMGVEVVMHSATKYLNGHSDHLAGVLAGSSERLEPLRLLSHKLGASLDPQVAYDLLRGLKTFALRMERHCATALRVARWLSEQRAVQRVWYPGLPSHPEHELAKRQMSGFGGMVTFTLGTKERAFGFWDRLRLVARAASLGGTETLSSLPILFSHTGYSAQELARAGVDEGMVRVSIGLEDPDDLIADLAQALEA